MSKRLRRWCSHLSAAVIGWQLLSASTAVAESARETPVVRAVRKAMPAVVNVSTERIVETPLADAPGFQPFDSSFERFFGAGSRRWIPQFNSLGSGVLIDQQGLVLTNSHVLENASRIVVTLSDGVSAEAVPVASDKRHDLALLQLSSLPAGRELTPASLAAPDDLFLGESVITVGNPFGLGHSVTVGILSARNRRVVSDSQVTFEDVLQTDAAINPGNSGGPLINADGDLIGITLAMDDKAANIGFAIPVKRVESVLARWLIPSRFSAGTLGLIPETEILANGKTAVRIAEVLPNSPAADVVRVGDRVLALNGKPVKRALDFGRRIWQLQPHQAITLDMADGRTLVLTVEEAPALDGPDLARNRLNLELEAVTPRLAEALGLPRASGLVVANVLGDGSKAPQGIQRGDVIVKINDATIASMTDFERILNAVRHGDSLKISVHRTSHRDGNSELSGFVLEFSL